MHERSSGCGDEAVSFFDRAARRYEHDLAPSARATGEDIRSIVSSFDIQAGVALDLGCGTGRAFPHLIEAGFFVIGLDASYAMLAETRRRSSAASVALIRADLYRRWPLRDGSIDLIVSLHSVLAHPPSDPPACFRNVGVEIARVIRRGGAVVLDLPDPQWARHHLRSLGNDFFAWEPTLQHQSKLGTIIAYIPDPALTVEMLGLPLMLREGPTGVRATGVLW